MAILNGKTFEGFHKSAGNLTFKNVNGKTVVSQKITQNKSNSPKQEACRFAFGKMVRIFTSFRTILNTGFEKGGNNSSQTTFIKWNSDLNNYLKSGKVENTELPAPFYLHRVLKDPCFLGQILSAKGNMNALSRFERSKEGALSGVVCLSRDFTASDQVMVGVIPLYLFKGQYGFSEQTYSIYTGDFPVQGENASDYFILDPERMPGLAEIGRIPPGAELIDCIVTAMVINGNDRSTSYFTLAGGGENTAIAGCFS